MRAQAKLQQVPVLINSWLYTVWGTSCMLCVASTCKMQIREFILCIIPPSPCRHRVQPSPAPSVGWYVKRVPLQCIWQNWSWLQRTDGTNSEWTWVEVNAIQIAYALVASVLLCSKASIGLYVATTCWVIDGKSGFPSWIDLVHVWCWMHGGV